MLSKIVQEENSNAVEVFYFCLLKEDGKLTFSLRSIEEIFTRKWGKWTAFYQRSEDAEAQDPLCTI